MTSLPDGEGSSLAQAARELLRPGALTVPHQSAKARIMGPEGKRSLLDALDEPAMVLEGNLVALANQPAQDLFGTAIEGRDVRLAVRHPQALEHILSAKAGDIDITGIGGFGHPWRLSIRRFDERSMLVRFADRSAAIAAEKMRVDFVANASHELRTPLSTILGYGETLAEDSKIDPQLCHQFGGVIRTEAKRMLRIIEDLMSLSRIEADRFVSPAERVSIAEIAQSAIDHATGLAGTRQCTLQLKAAEHLPLVQGDHAQLAQLFDNLLSNAVRYGCENENCAIQVSAVREKSWVRISVADNGPGIAREHLPRITQRFYRADPARSRESGGTGLGLAIVKHIVERHKGMLDIRSTPGEGTEVIVRLPIAS